MKINSSALRWVILSLAERLREQDRKDGKPAKAPDELANQLWECELFAREKTKIRADLNIPYGSPKGDSVIVNVISKLIG